MLDQLQARPKGCAWPGNADKLEDSVLLEWRKQVKAHSWLERTLEGQFSMTTSCCPGSVRTASRKSHSVLEASEPLLLGRASPCLKPPVPHPADASAGEGGGAGEGL